MLTRRAMLTSTPALALAVATPAAAACVMPIERPDAELIRLGAEFDRRYQELMPLRAVEGRLCDEWETAVRARGLTFQNDYKATMALRVEMGAEKAVGACCKKLDEIDETTRAIRSIRPATLAGLAVHARVCRFDCLAPSAMEGPREDWDWDVMVLHDFLADIERMAEATA